MPKNGGNYMVHIVWSNKNGKLYAYFAVSKRLGNRVLKRKQYFGSFSDEKLSMKDLVWLLAGKEGISKLRQEELQKWIVTSSLYKLRPFPHWRGLTDKEIKTAIRNIIAHVGLAPCACFYIIKHGIPTTFKEVFDKYEITELLHACAIQWAKATQNPDFILLEPDEYFQGKPSDYERAKQFLLEDPSEQN